MCKDIQTDMFPRSRVVGALFELRHVWEDNASGVNIIDTRASVGLLLYDVAEMISPNTDERLSVFGEIVSQELDKALGGTSPVCTE
jgi:hypothetical protein